MMEAAITITIIMITAMTMITNITIITTSIAECMKLSTACPI